LNHGFIFSSLRLRRGGENVYEEDYVLFTANQAVSQNTNYTEQKFGRFDEQGKTLLKSL